MDPDPAIFVTDLQNANKRNNFFLTFCLLPTLKVDLHNFSKKFKRSHKTVGIKVFLLFLLDRRILKAQKHVDPVDPEHWNPLPNMPDAKDNTVALQRHVKTLLRLNSSMSPHLYSTH
jgi:hypothetical protein